MDANHATGVTEGRQELAKSSVTEMHRKKALPKQERLLRNHHQMLPEQKKIKKTPRFCNEGE